jgi:hypothetical protein
MLLLSFSFSFSFSFSLPAPHRMLITGAFPLRTYRENDIAERMRLAASGEDPNHHTAVRKSKCLPPPPLPLPSLPPPPSPSSSANPPPPFPPSRPLFHRLFLALFLSLTVVVDAGCRSANPDSIDDVLDARTFLLLSLALSRPLVARRPAAALVAQVPLSSQAPLLLSPLPLSILH